MIIKRAVDSIYQLSIKNMNSNKYLRKTMFFFQKKSFLTKISAILTTFVDYFALCFAFLLIFLLQVLPNFATRLLAQCFMKLILLFLPRSKAVAQRNLELAFPEKSFAEREKIRKQAINVLADNLIGFAWAPSLNKTSVRQLGDFSSAIALVRKATENQTKGAIFLIPHFGRFELIAQIWAIAYQPGWIIARGFNLPRFSRWWNSIRECHGNKILDRNGAYQEIMPLLKNGKNVSIMFDQNVKRNHAIFVDLFGIKAATTKSFALAALRTGSPIIFAAIIEKSYKKFEIEAREIYNPWQEDKPAEQKIEEITLEANRCLEDIIRRHPEHWFWIHRRFKTRPVGEPEDIYQTSGATF